MLQDGIELSIFPVAHVIPQNSDKSAGEPIELVIRELGGK